MAARPASASVCALVQRLRSGAEVHARVCFLACLISRYSFWQVGVARVCMLGETMVDERNMNVTTPKSIVWTHRYLGRLQQ